MGDGRRGTGFWGSGFFIAPGWVLTSAHVVGQGRGAVWRGERAIGISTADSGQFTGELACALPKPLDPERPPSPWGAPDLALVRVPELEHGSGVFNGSGAGAGPDCLWLSDRSALTPAKVGLYGYMRDPSGEFCVGDEGMAGGGTGGGPLMLRGNLPSGCSGGPVVDLVRASVIGVCRARAKDASNSALATPVTALRDFCDADPRAYAAWQEALRAHDRYHLSRYHGPGRSWPRIQVDLARYGHGFTADHRAE
ncbi:MAG: trypsin-like peptidase domain-containing protein, partial [Streptomyces sp.]